MKGATAFTSANLDVGDPVRVWRKPSPLAGESGRILEISPDDIYGPYLVQFDSGLRFRYRRGELTLTDIPDSAT